MKIAAFPNQSASSLWRIKHPLKYLNNIYGYHTNIFHSAITEDIVSSFDTFLLQGIVDKAGIALMYAYQQEHGKKIIVDIDDYLEVNDSNPHKIEHEISDAVETLKKTLEIADLVTTTNGSLQKYLSKYNKNVVILPNYMDLDFWEKPSYKNDSDRIRIGWAGSITHLDDIKLLINPLTKIVKEFPQVQVVMVGDPRIKEYLPFAECYLGVPYEAWASKLHGLRLDIALAPLADNKFNKCKSPIKWMEYSIAKVAGIYSPTVYNRHVNNQFGLIARTDQEWYQCIKNMIICPALKKDLIHDSYRQVTNFYNLENHIDKWYSAYERL